MNKSTLSFKIVLEILVESLRVHLSLLLFRLNISVPVSSYSCCSPRTYTNGRYLTALISCQIRAMGREIGPPSERRDLSVGGWRRLGNFQRGGGLLEGKKKERGGNDGSAEGPGWLESLCTPESQVGTSRTHQESVHWVGAASALHPSTEQEQNSTQT